ncbi:glutathione-dependent reductase [Gilliamella sp. Occ3-1]|uniref:glutathione S-transferase family protein n=1 Tax=Gilliamella sp. Occ3-1 TaxID=3120253 RepID=UPI00080DD5CA|nr:glutathione S-transferase C-terminal domain-containing protein [Gilliamella apicola]OCG72474.1 glutathione-dependent reductase [Gilliamella apicola]
MSLVIGKIVTTENNEIDKNGAFVRQTNRFVTQFGDKSGQLPVKAGRYRLIWAAVCPWAHRSMIAIKLLGLEDVISVGKVNPIRTSNGWEFSLDANGKDPVLGIRYLPEIYALTDPQYNGRATVPTVVDVKTGKVVNNDYFKLTYYWATAFKPFHKANAPDLYPEKLRADIDALNDVIFHEVNNGVYKAGFARSQKAYEDAYYLVFNQLDKLEQRLSQSRYLFGDKITDSDLRLYVTLARFDVAYYSAFKTNRNRIIDYPNLWAYARDLYQIPAFGETTDFEAIKKGYFLGVNSHNPYDILPLGPDVSNWHTPHNRSQQFSSNN